MAIVMKRYDRSLAEEIERAGDGLDPSLARRYGCSLFRTLRQLHEMTPTIIVQVLSASAAPFPLKHSFPRRPPARSRRTSSRRTS